MSGPARDPEPGPALLVDVPAVVVASRNFRAGLHGHGPEIAAGTIFDLQPPGVFSRGYEERGGALVLLAGLAAGLLFVGDLVPAAGRSAA